VLTSRTCLPSGERNLGQGEGEKCENPIMLVWRCLQGEGVHGPEEVMDGREKILCVSKLCT
jgi:hypothetical protein